MKDKLDPIIEINKFNNIMTKNPVDKKYKIQIAFIYLF